MEATYIKFKNIFMICMLLILLVSLSAVVASDSSDTNTLKSDTNTTVQAASNDVGLEQDGDVSANAELESGSDLLSASSDEDILGEGTKSDLENIITNNDNISLNDGYAINSQIQITSNKEIDGQNNYIRATGSNNRIFQITSNAVVTLKNIIFKDGKSNEGGALYVSSGEVNIINCTFESNGGSSNGGAIYVNNARVNITDCTFKSNGATTSNGGAIYVNNNARVNITDCIFESNGGSSNGGAIYVNNNARVNITDCIFESNGGTTSNYGGAIYVGGNPELNITGSTFRSNKARYSGGAIYVNNGQLNITDCIFESNGGSSNGGAIYVNNNARVNITGSTFKSNGCTTSNGGAIYTYTMMFNIIDSTFELNTAKNGGSIYSDYNSNVQQGCAILMINNTFNDNHATNEGGAINFNTINGNINISGSTFKKNTCGGSGDTSGGGAIRFSNTLQFGTNAYISKSTFEDNHAKNAGALFSHRTTVVTIDSCNFTKNTADVEGGVMRHSYIVNVKNSLFWNNTSKKDGGCFCAGQDAADLNLDHCEFENNTANRWGGVVQGRNINVNYCIFKNNSVNVSAFAPGQDKFNTARGGALFCRLSKISTSYCTFINNIAQEGGAICLEDRSSRADISHTNFTNNKATVSGGAIFDESNAQSEIIYSRFELNTAQNGGAIYRGYVANHESTSSVNIKSVTFKSNSATSMGGAVYMKTHSSVISYSTFDNNDATVNGGAVYWLGNNGLLSESEFTSNSAGNGSSVYWAGNNGKIEKSNFYDVNQITTSVYWFGSDGTLLNNNFHEAKGVYVSHGSSLTLDSNKQSSANIADFSVYNNGTASFSSNTFYNYIENNGTILTQTYAKTFNNETKVTDENSLMSYVSIEDDNGNFIKINANISIEYLSNTLNTIFNNTHYVAFASGLPTGYTRFTSKGHNNSGLSNLAVKHGGVLYLLLNLTVNITNYGEKVDFTTVIINTTINGTVVLTIDDISYNVTVINGTGIFTQYNMAPNDYIVVAAYTDYNQTIYANTTMSIYLRNSTLSITANNITYGGVVTVNVTATNGTTGNVLIFINGKAYTVKLVNSTGQLNLTNLPGGTYTVFGVYNGDTNFNGNYNSTQFNVAKHNLTINITATNISVGRTAVINVKLPADINGTVYVYVDSVPYVYTKQPITLSVANLTAGNHTVRVIYDGDDKYLAGTNSTIFKVNKLNIRPTITALDIKVGDNATITVNLNGAINATGIVLFTVNGKNYYADANRTKATLIISGLEYGKYNVTATYLEDDTYNSNSTKGSFKVDYVVIDPKITYAPDDNLDVVVNVTVPADVNGDIIIEVDGKNYTSYIFKGLFSVPINNLTGGTYPAKMYFANDTKYHAVNKSFNITLKKIDPTINVNATYIYVGDNATITVTVPYDARGNVTISVYNDNYTGNNYTVNVTNGTAVFSVPGLAYGRYDVIATYSGDRKYNVITGNVRFNVRKLELNIDVSVEDIFVGETAIFNITMPGDVNDKVYLTVQNQNYTVNITNGSGQINITGLKYGYPVPVHVEFKGNEKYLERIMEYTAFSVHRISNYPMNITAVTGSSSVNITVNIPDDANGTGYFTIDNKNYTIKFTNGKSNMTIVTDLDPGAEYVVYAYFNGTDKYARGDTVKTLNSNKTTNYTFDVRANDIFVGEVSYLTIYLPNITNGTVTIRVPGRPAVSIKVNETFVNGTYIYPIYDLKAGAHEGSVTYDGNDIYEPVSRYGTILVSKRTVSAIVEYNTTYVGQNLTLKVTFPTDANGTVSLTINNKIYNATLTNGTAHIIVPNLEAKTYNGTIFYRGNEKYNNYTQNGFVTVLRVPDYLFDVGVVDIKVGDNETITLRLPSDMDVNVTISIPGTAYINKTVEIINGTGNITIPNLPAGVYNVTAVVVNSSKYLDHTVTHSFTVSTIEDYLFNLHNLTAVYVRDNITFILDLPKDAKGNVTVVIFNQTYTGEVKNGTATINVTSYKEGNYPFTISFEQKGKYDFKSQVGYAFVIKKEVTLNPIYNATVYVGDNITFQFILPKDATGNVSITSRGVKYTAELINGSANVTIASYPVESSYSPFISYDGDDKYYSDSTTVAIKVIKVKDYDLNVTVANITVEQDEIVNISLPKDVTEDVLISGNFSDNTFSVKLVNGTAKFVISDLPAGNYSINVRYQGYQKYEDKNVTLTFNVRKVVPPIAIEFVNNDTVIVLLPTHANGNATVVITNNESVVKINTEIEIVNGRGVLNVSGLRPGDYSVNATFLGGARYLQNTTTKTITIPKIEDYILPISVGDIIVGENATIIIIVPENATGHVNITIDGGNVIQVPIVGNVAIYNAAGLKVGSYTVQANYSNVEYVFKTNSTKFDVKKIKTIISPAISANVTNLTVNATLNKLVSGGNVTICIDGKTFNFTNIVSNKINLTVPILPGRHTVEINYSGDENHTAATSISYIDISKITDYTLIVNATSLITVMDNNVVNVTLPKGANGTVSIYLNGRLYGNAKVNSTTGIATLILPRLESDYYTVLATYSNEIYDYKQNTTAFTVIRLNTTVDVQVENITKDLSEIINITLNQTATGELLVDVNGTVYQLTLTNGNATLTLSNLNKGNYRAVVTYTGDDNFNPNSTTVYFTVSKIPINITISAKDIFIGQEANFTIETSSPITDQVIVRIDNKNYTAIVYNGKGNLIVLGQNVGLHNVTVFYAGDDNYLPATNKTNITVFGKKPTSVTVNVTNITVGESVTIYINVTGDVNGTVAIAMLGNPIIVQMVNGTGNYTYYDLVARDYHFTVAYFESEFYLPSNATGDFTVFKRSSPISANVTNATITNVEIITVNLPANATGTVLLSVNGSNYYSKVDGGVAKFNITGLPVGNHTAYITYEGDSNYLENVTEVNFTTSKITTTINITTATNVIVDGQPVVLTIMTSANLTEVVTVKIVYRDTGGIVLENNTFIENGVGTFTALGIRTGNYTAYVRFPGNAYYGEANNLTNFSIAGKDPTSLTVEVKNITLGEVACIYVNVTGATTGNVTLNIAGDSYTKDVFGGKVNFTVPNLPARDYHITVTYLENDDYLPSNATAEFTVFRKGTPISANVTNAPVGNVEQINVTVNVNATGTVLLTVNGSNYYGIIDGGVAVFNVTGLPFGNHTAYITYEGDSNYLGNSTEVNITTAKLTTTINITAPVVVVDNHPVTFTIKTSANFTEVITVRIVNRDTSAVVSSNHTFVENGVGTFISLGLRGGNYTAYASFAGNTHYDAVSNSTNFTVAGKLPTSLTVEVKNITLGEVAVIYVNVTGANTGKVTLNMAGNPQTNDVVGGKVNFTVPNLLARDYHVTVTYLENNEYLSSNATADFTVFKKQSNIRLNVSNIYVGEYEYVIVNVTSGATGIVLINIAGIQVYAQLNESNAIVVFDDLGIGQYNVTAIYMGDSNYLNSTAKGSFNVTQLKTTIEIEGSDITVGQTEKFNITTSANITEVVFIEINGTNYTSFVKDGNGTFTVPFNLAEGTYTVYVYFPGNSKYEGVKNQTVIKVSPKKSSDVTVNVESIPVGDNLTVNVNVTAGTTGTVAISVAGETHLVLLNNSKASLTLTNLTARHYHVTAYYLGDEHYLESNSSAEFDVFKKQSSINVTAKDITVDDVTTISINITNGTTGVVLIDINGTDYFANINNGVAKLDVKNLAVGNYTVTVRYEGDTNYNASSNVTTFKVSKLNSYIAIDLISISPIAHGNDVLVNVTGPKDVTGIASLNVTLEGQSVYYTVYINNGEGLLIISKPHTGHYTVSAIYEENYKYLSNSSNTVGFEVYANGTELEVIVHNIYVGETENITVIIAGAYSGDVNITIDGTILRQATLVYNSTTNSSVAVLHYSDKLDSGIHTVVVTYVAEEGGKIITHKGSESFFVYKINSTVEIKPIVDIKVGQNATIGLTLLPEDATGTIDVYVNGILHTIDATNLNLTVPDLAAGYYMVQAMYVGDAKYESSSANASFTVFKNDIRIVLDVEDITVALSENVNVTLINATGDIAKDANGHVLININGTHYYAEIKDGVARISIDLAVGKYNVNATFVGDDKYYGNSTDGAFNVSKLTTGIEITATDIFFGQDEVFKFTTSENLTVVVIVEVNSNNYTAFIKDGKGNFTVSGLAAGPYNAIIYFNGNERYGAISNVTNFTVTAKHASSINVSVEDITVGENITVYVNATEGINGPGYVTIAGVAYTCDLVNGRANFTVSGLSARDYVVSVFFMGNEEYELCNNTSNFTVYHKDTGITITVTNSTVGSVEYINVTFADSDAKGTVLLTIGESRYFATIESGVAKFNVTGLLEGIYDVTVNYEGDNVYNPTSGTAKVNITKLTTTIGIEAVNITAGQDEVFTITTSANFTEVVTIRIVGVNNYTAYVINGTGTFTVPDELTAGNYTVYVDFPGNTQYGPAQGSANFTVKAKKLSEITVAAVNITVGQNATITVNVTKGATGDVTIVIAGDEYTKTLDENGVAVFNISGLSARDYHVTAIYRGDTFYESSTGTANFTVNKKDTSFSITVTNSTVGSVEYINVTFADGDAEGTVLLTIGGSQYFATIENGVAKFNVTGLKEGIYDVTVNYEGGNVYNPTAGTAKVNITKLTTTIGIEAVNITAGQDEVFTITTSANFTEVVTIRIVGVNNYTAYVINGTGTFTVPDELAAGNYTVYVDFPGNTQYGPAQGSANFTVKAKKLSEITVAAVNITVGQNATITVNVTKGATGDVTIVIAGDEYTKTLDENGVAVFNISGLSARDYHVTAIYRGDTYYSGNQSATGFTVSKLASEVDLNVSDIIVGETELINVTVTPNNASGVVLINISGTCYYAELKDGKAAFKVPGLTAGTYEAKVTYEGNDIYNASVASKSFVVRPEITVTAGPNNGNTTELTIDVGDNSTGEVTVVVNGTTYTAKVENGTAKVNVSGENPGVQNVTVIYTPEGKDPYSQNTTVDVPKVTDYPIVVEVIDVDKTNGTATIKVQAPKDATGNVTVKIGNQTIPVKLNENGTAIVTVGDIPVGSHDIDVSYGGDGKYAAQSNRTHVNMPIGLPTINVVDHLVRGWNSQFDYEAVFTNEFGEVLVNTTVTFIVNGKAYNVQTESHGIARLTETLPVGEYTVTSINPVTGENVTKTLSIVPRLINNKDLTMDFADGSHWDVLVIGDDGNPVGAGEIIDIYVNTIHYVAYTDAHGVAKLKINLNPNTFKISAYYKNYNVTNDLVVKQTLKLVKKTVKAKRGKKFAIKAKLQWSNGKAMKGKKIVFKFKGKKYTAKTNSKGIAKVVIKKNVAKKLKKGKKYKFTATYISNTVKGKVKVKK